VTSEVAAENDVTKAQLRWQFKEADGNAASQLLMFLDEPLCSQVHRFSTGSQIWAFLEQQHEVWLSSRGPVLENDKKELAPLEDESVGAYCLRAILLQADLKSADRAVADVSMVEALLQGLVAARPEWLVHVQGLKGTFSGVETLELIQPKLASWK
jgi:hypothetical protein